MTDVEGIDKKGPFDRLTKKAALVVTICGVLFYFFFDFLWGPERGRAASICAAMIVTVVWMRWDLRRQFWFWLTIAVVVLLHVPLVLLIRWPNGSYPGVVLLPGALLDLAVVYGCVKFVEILMKERRRR
jgi:hypothetical protein